MKKILERQSLATKHLSILDEVLRNNDPSYRDISLKLNNVPLYDDFLREIYAGGKRRGKYGRQMILGDLLQYILTGRGYYFAIKGTNEMKSFIKIIMYIANLLILMENISVDVYLRNKVLDALINKIGENFFENDIEKEAFKKLRTYKGKIVGNEGKEHENFFDSILPSSLSISCSQKLLFLISKIFF